MWLTHAWLSAAANYRRLLGDLDWPHDTPVASALAYTPLPLLALRTCKAEVLVGVQRDVEAAVAARDPAYLTNGVWAVAQYVSRG